MKNSKKSRHSERDLAGAPALLGWLTSQAGRNYLTSLRPPSRLSSNPCIRPARPISCEPQETIALGLLHVADLQSGRIRCSICSALCQFGWLYELPVTFRTDWHITSETELSKLLRNTITDRPAIFFVSASWAGILT